MTNFDLYKLMHAIAGKDVYSGWLSPDVFQTLLQTENIRLLRDRLGLPERYQPGTFQAGGAASRVIETDLAPFLVFNESLPLTNGETNLTDWYYINDWYTANSITAEIISQQELGARIHHPILKQDTRYPYAIIISRGLKIYPKTISSISISYYREPVTPTFVTSVNIATGELMYMPSTELEWNDDGKIDIGYRILQSLGVNTERQDVEQLAQKLVEGGK